MDAARDVASFFAHLNRTSVPFGSGRGGAPPGDPPRGGGHVHGATDELGYNAVEDVVSVHDLHATMLHLLGIDHERLTVRFQGRDYRLTDVSGRVVSEILA